MIRFGQECGTTYGDSDIQVKWVVNEVVWIADRREARVRSGRQFHFYSCLYKVFKVNKTAL